MKMTSTEFLKQMYDEVRNFVEYWEDQRKQNPSNWPDKMELADWLNHLESGEWGGLKWK